MRDFLAGSAESAHQYTKTRWVFLRLLGLINAIAFLSLWVQIHDLIGENGILPAADFLREVHGSLGDAAYRLLPTLGWLSASDPALHCMCAVGTLCSLLLILDVCPPLMLFLAWLCYLSLLKLGQDFLSFQWDILLLETNFLAIWWAPLQLRPIRAELQTLPSMAALWLLRLLLLRLMVESGWVKLASGDETWLSLTALKFHYWTQPLPTPLAWYANQLPDWFQKLSCLLMFVIEMGLPWLMFGPRRARLGAFAGLFLLQILIALTGNYTFFNLLTMALCVTLLDDNTWPMRRRVWWEADVPRAGWPPLLMAGVSLLLLFLSIATIPRVTIRWADSLHLANRYGLFAIMTTTRNEIIIEGSNDGQNWEPYEFRYKPGDVMRAPPLVAPYQPRLDWQMWFAALGNYRAESWFLPLCERLLQGRPQVLALLARNPFPQAPPRMLRAMMYSYTFTRRGQGAAWWKREPAGMYLPQISLRR